MQEPEAVQQIPETVAQVLDVLGEKFGATGAHLWEVMVRQQVIEAWGGVLLIGVPWLIFIGCFTTAVYASFHKDHDIEEFFGFAALVAVFFAAILTLTMGNVVLTGFFNPEYGALREVLRTIGG